MKRYRLLSILVIVFLCFYCQNQLSAKEFNLKEFKEKIPELLSATNAGTEFWTIFNPNWETDITDLMLYISSQSETNVTLEVPGKGYIRKKKTVPNDIIELKLTPSLGQCYRKTDRHHPEPDSVYPGYGVHVFSEQPILVLCASRADYSSDSYLALPVSSLGNEYVVASWPDIADDSLQYLSCYTAIISPYEENIVSFTMGGTKSSKTAGGQLPGETRNYNLSKGDVLSITSLGHLADLSGSHIKSSKPVSVISSNFCAQVPVETPYCDYMCEMELPFYTWGKHYFYTPIYGRLKNSIIRIFTKEAGTTLYRDGIQLAKLDSASGLKNVGWLSIRADEGAPRPIVFSGDKPIYVVQYNCSQDDDSVQSDPFMMVLPPYEQFQKEITFNTPGIKGGGGFSINYLNLVYKASETDSIPEDLEIGLEQGGQFVWRKLLDIDPNPGQSFSILINGKKFSNKTIKLPADGVYKIRANDPFCVYAYGFTPWESYGHPASAALWDLSKNDYIPPKPTWTLTCDGTVDDGIVEDLPNDSINRSNLYTIIFQSDSSFNFEFQYDDFIPREVSSTKWYANVIDKRKDAKAVVSFIDGSGNDTTIEINYYSDFLNIKPDVDFGKLKIGDTVIKEVWGYNEQSHPIMIDSLILKYNDKGFELLNQNFPLILDEGSSIMFRLRFIATK
ncbi:MAG: hypothetical protein EPN82_13415, partial [Bacteroidetes bacterium]